VHTSFFALLDKFGEFVVQRLEQGVLKHRAISLLFTLERNNSMKEKEKMATERIRSGFFKFAGYLVPLVQSLPVWAGLMTLPFAGYLIMLFTNLPVNLPRALRDFFVPFPILEKVFIIISLLILVYSVAYLVAKRKEGLVTSGPYRLIRHPQYLGMILSTLGLTSWSVWILNNTFGIGFLSPAQTIGVWFIELSTYILLAHIEEQHLSKKFGEPFQNYKNQVPFFIPYLKTNRTNLDTLISILIPVALLFGLISLHIRVPVLL
jgi:protein-S-isoprenylcysteine O-methyltransferase Ste14